MSCDQVDRWLDAGMPARDAETIHAHVLGCARCAEMVRVEQALERALTAPPGRASADFTDRVMARVGGRTEAPVLTPALSWWIRAAMEPVTVLALAALGAIAWGWQGLWTLATVSRVAFAQGSLWLSHGTALSANGSLAVQLALGCLLALSAGALFRMVGRLAGRVPMTRP